MESNISLHLKLSSILETLAQSAITELSKAVDEDTVELRLELMRLQTLNSVLKQKVDTLENELTAARSDAPGLSRSRRTVGIQTDEQVQESQAPVIEGVFGKDWCFNLWNEQYDDSPKIFGQQADYDIDSSMDLDHVSPSTTPVLEMGAEFSSFESLTEAIENWQRSNFVELYKRGSRTVQNAKKRTRKKSYNSNLVFAELDYACAHASKGSELKRCPFTIRVRVTPDGRKLYIKDISPVNCHNHELSKAVMTGPDSGHADPIQVKVEEYLDGIAITSPNKNLSLKNDDEIFSEELELMPAWTAPMDADSLDPNYNINGMEEQSAQSADGLENGLDVVGNSSSEQSLQASSSAAENKYVCLRCDIVFYNPSTLMQHQRAHQRYWCDVCKEQFATKAEMKQHNCDMNPNKCRLCGKTWASQSALQTHMVVHTGDKRFVCRFCGQRFAQKGNMRNHLIRMHKGCDECGMTFNNKSQLMQHLLKHKMRTIRQGLL
ncbi:zinc finger protein 90 homolog isoform X2 [Corythoichthys intestinalis]|uniref:zinc finger protein 90 homolog isoform X2 n=1 Tax=Corythoichthys intestinalis TaxID=161448 RepID=UPI0025A5D10C|nr:zinc finger protein 90 homolog isoform X2 [Corythoichthys intestinalis]